jgi:hypothetical protein
MTRVSLVQGTPINRNGDEGQGGAPRSSFRRVIEGRQNGGRGRVSRGWRRGRDKRVSFLQVNDKERQKRWVRWEGRAVAVVVFVCVGLPRCSGSQALWGKCRLRQGRLSVAAQDRLQPRTSINSCREGRPGVAEESNNRTTTVYCKNGEVSEACVRVIDSAAQSQYRSVDPRHTFKGKSQRIHALRIAACRPLGH